MAIFIPKTGFQTIVHYKDSMFQNDEKPMESVQVLDVVLRSAFKNIRNAIPVARGLYFPPNKRMDLEDGMELWLGLFQATILGRDNIYLNVDVLHKAFPSSMHLLDYIATYISKENRVPNELDNRSCSQLKEFLKMLTIGYRIKANEPIKTYGFNDLIDPKNATFTDENGRKMSVAQYFQQARGIRLRYPNLPYLWVGSRTRNVYLPIEFCEISAGQATNKKCTPKCTAKIIKYSATSTDERKAKIRDLLNKITYDNPAITGFGINVDKAFQKIEGRIIDPPDLKYKNGTVKPQRGAWRDGKYLETPIQPIKWCIINCDAYIKPQDVMELKKNILNAARQQSMNLMDFQAQEIISVPNFRNQNFKRDIGNALGNCLKAGYRFVMVIITEQPDCYPSVKQAAELEVGILTQCLKGSTINRMGRGNPMMTINNILHKVNSKLNGKNQEIQEISYNSFNKKTEGVMFIGADVTHPTPDAKNDPSVVGVACSYDDVGFKYCCAWRIQDPRKEMIIDLADILSEHLKFYEAKNKRLPAKIMYYRDGVSDGQFKEVLNIEMSAIQEAMRRVYGPNKPAAAVTFIVVQKRHHTRFFPTSKDTSDGSKFNNIPPGTVVDKNIVHPFQYQFFMASHAAIQGVTKPTKYCILINESKIQPDDLQAITYDLCHLFTRCNRSVSYPAPTYYAHLVAARGKVYITNQRLNMSNLQREYTMRAIKPAIVRDSPMFFV